MAKPIAPAKGIAFAFPDVCLTPAAPSPVPIPYPNIAQLDQASPVSDAAGASLFVGPAGDAVLLQDGTVSPTTGDEAGTGGGGVRSGTTGTTGGVCTLTGASATVLYGPEGKGLVRFLDTADQNGDPPNVTGVVLSAFPTVLVGD